MLLCLVYIRAGTLIFGATENLSCITCLKTTAISLQNKCDIQWICVFLITLQDMYIQVLGKKVTREDNVRVGLCQGKILCYIHKLYMHHHCHACNLLTQIQRKLILKWEVHLCTFVLMAAELGFGKMFSAVLYISNRTMYTHMLLLQEKYN